MNWSSHEFIWLDWVVLIVGLLGVVAAVWYAIWKDKKAQQGEDSSAYLFGKGEPWYVIGMVIFSNLLVTSLLAILEINSRTREIGLYRSLGAKSSYVRSVFFVEQGFIGLFSGVLGIGLAYALIPIINLFIKNAVTAAVISNFAVLHWYVAIIVAIVSVLIGVASTVFPAIFATRTKPSKALRSI